MVNKQSGSAGLRLTFALTLAAVAAYLVHSFFLSMAWAGIICIATWPLYLRARHRFGSPVLASLACVVLLAATLMIPAIIGLRYATEEAPVLAQAVATANNSGVPQPAWLAQIPFVGESLQHWWLVTLAEPHWLSHLLSEGRANRLLSAPGLLRQVGFGLLRRLVDIGFAFLTLFFFYKNGFSLAAQVNMAGARLFGSHGWHRYVRNIPNSIRGTVNGLVMVGLGEGALIGIGYGFAGLPSAAIWAAATGLLAIIPFGAPIVFLSAAGLLLAGGHGTAAAGVAGWSFLVLLVADHFVRPKIIGDATNLPFLVVLFGILGGVETLGLVGLFIGPVVMALVVTLWRECSTPGEPMREPGEDDEAAA